MRKPILSFLVLLALADTARAHAQNMTDFSIDAFSPEVTRFTIGDLILFDGSGVAVGVQQLGLPATANVDGFSYGNDRLVPFGPNFFVALEFSVSRLTTGAGGAVTIQVQADSAAGDKFVMYILRNGRSIGPFLQSNADQHGLTASPPIQSNIDGLSFLGDGRMPIFWTVDANTAQALGLDPATIYVTPDPATPAFQVYRSAADMQLQGEDIDGIAVADAGVAGQFDAADVIYVSLTGSGTRLLYCGGPPNSLGNDCIIQIEPTRGPGVFPPGRAVVTATQLDLRGPPSPDQLDAFTGIDPGPCLDEVPPPPPPKQEQQQKQQEKGGWMRELADGIATCITKHNSREAEPGN